MTTRLTYNSVNIDGITVDTPGIEVSIAHQKKSHRSGSGKIETISRYCLTNISFNGFFSEPTYDSLLSWYSWAKSGQEFSFALDSGDTFSTTVDDDADAGQKVIPLTATSGLTVGDRCLLKTVTSDNIDVVEIDSISAGVSVTAVSNLAYDYVATDLFNHFDYWPALVLKPSIFKPTRVGILDTTSSFYFSYRFDFEESP